MQNMRRYYDTRKRYPHLVNAVKYVVAQSVVVFGVFNDNFLHHDSSAFNVGWVSVYVCSTLYSYSWDVAMDWGSSKIP